MQVRAFLPWKVHPKSEKRSKQVPFSTWLWLPPDVVEEDSVTRTFRYMLQTHEPWKHAKGNKPDAKGNGGFFLHEVPRTGKFMESRTGYRGWWESWMGNSSVMSSKFLLEMMENSGTRQGWCLVSTVNVLYITELHTHKWLKWSFYVMYILRQF